MTTPETLHRWDFDHVWHPFTQAMEWEDDGEPLIIEAAVGCTLMDVHGNQYLDGISSLWTNVHGHNHPTINRAIESQLQRVAHSTLLGQAGRPSIELARRLAVLLSRIDGPEPALTRTFYSDSGSTAVEVALKMAFQFHQQTGEKNRTRFAALTEAYHGDTMGSVSVGGIDLFHKMYRPMLFDAVRVPAPDRADPNEEDDCIQRARALFDAHGEAIAALVVEPLVQGAAGMRMHSPNYLQTIIRMARAAGALVICDEVAVGFGRTGTMFAMEQVGCRPDIMCLAKGISGGYLPLAATVVSDRIYDAFRGPYGEYKTLFHGHTYTGNALACASALGSLDVFEEEQTIASLPPKVDALGAALAALPHAHIKEIRHRGLMGAAILRHTLGANARIGHRVAMTARNYGVIVRPLGDAIIFMPPLSMTELEIDALGQAVGCAVADVLGRST
ncbi:MAG: adenosylmethionine--8-amino-7-oxononanoate transaminase [Myxococcota bacterium]|nr:adenosylmethionine--8-amino-7-oxononanoate transaminase [Myxococcota bacterium]